MTQNSERHQTQHRTAKVISKNEKLFLRLTFNSSLELHCQQDLDFGHDFYRNFSPVSVGAQDGRLWRNSEGVTFPGPNSMLNQIGFTG